MNEIALFSAEHAYDLAAREYEHWQWQDVWRRIEAPQVLARIADGVPGPVLDLGTGTGFYASVLHEAKVSVVGLDISEEMLVVARKLTRGAVPMVRADAAMLPFGARTFSQIVAARMLSHVRDVRLVFSEAARVLKPGGTFIVSEIDPEHNYSHTRLPFRGSKLAVQTFKRSRRQLIQVARRSGNFRLQSQNWVRTSDLPGANHYALSSLKLSGDLPLAVVFSLVLEDA